MVAKLDVIGIRIFSCGHLGVLYAGPAETKKLDVVCAACLGGMTESPHSKQRAEWLKED